jgi:hypothetical protein
VLRQTPCGSVEDLARSLGRDDLGDPHRTTLASGDTLTLAEPPPPTKMPRACRGFGPRNESLACTTVLVEVAGAAPVLAQAPRSWTESDGSFLFADTPESECRARLSPGTSAIHGALTLVARPGGLDLRAGDRVFSTPVSLAEINARAPGEKTGCRSMRDEYRALLSSAVACMVDTDCQAVPSAPIPGEGLACHGFVNRSAAALLEMRAGMWRAVCAIDSELEGCWPAQPAACRNGACVETCPGAKLEVCPQSCALRPLRPGGECVGWELCRQDAATFCFCENKVVTCGRHPRAVPGCPVQCLDPPTPGPTQNDAGVSDDAAGDADAPDALAAAADARP